MGKKVYEPLRVRPKNATPELAVRLRNEGMTLQQIADAWGVSKNRVWQLVRKAEKNNQQKG